MLAAGLIDVARVKVLARELAPVGYDTAEDQALVDGLVERAAESDAEEVAGRCPDGGDGVSSGR